MKRMRDFLFSMMFAAMLAMVGCGGGGGSSGGDVEDVTPPIETPDQGENGGEDSGGDGPATPDVNQAKIDISFRLYENGNPVNGNLVNNNDTVHNRFIMLSGEIDSGEAPVTRLDIFVGDKKFSADVQDGTFEKVVILDLGENSFSFETWAGDQSVPNDMDDPFSLILNLPNPLDLAVIQVTLTWDRDDTDVDLYVVDPTNEFSYFNHKVTTSGGELDVDVRDGYGPEHWTLTWGDVIQWGQSSYRVRVHYYGQRPDMRPDPQEDGTNFTVKVKLYEGTSREFVYEYSGFLSEPRLVAGDRPPNSSYVDWDDVHYEVVLDPAICLEVAPDPSRCGM